jgi:hypothetical protein
MEHPARGSNFPKHVESLYQQNWNSVRLLGFIHKESLTMHGHTVFKKPPVCSLRLGPGTTFHTHKKGLRVRNVEILNEPSVIHSECRRLLFLCSVVVYQDILKLLVMSSKLRRLQTVE